MRHLSYRLHAHNQPPGRCFVFSSRRRHTRLSGDWSSDVCSSDLGSRGCIPDTPGETGIHLEWKQRTPLCSREATGISWSSLGGLKRVKPPEAFGERSRDWSLGHAGDEGPHLAMPGESWGCSRAAAPVCAFSRGTTARSVSLSWGAREVGSPCEWRGRAP